MRDYKLLNTNQKKKLSQDLKNLNQVSKVYLAFDKEYQIAKKQSKNINKNFDSIFSVAKKYGIGEGAFNISSVQDVLIDLTENLKNLSVSPDSILHQALDDMRMIENEFGGRKSDWLANPSEVTQEGHCLQSDISEIKDSFNIKHS